MLKEMKRFEMFFISEYKNFRTYRAFIFKLLKCFLFPTSLQNMMKFGNFKRKKLN